MVLVFLLIVLAIIIICNVRTVHQEHVVIVERFGKFHTAWNAGLHVKIPFIDSIRKDVSLKEQTYDFPESRMITRDNIMVMVDSVVYTKVFDAHKYYYGIEDPVFGIENLTATALRSIVGSKTFDELLNSREEINQKITAEIDEATDAWGIKVKSVELKKIEASHEVQETMQKEMTAEREKRATILNAQAHQESVIATAEGDKRAQVLAAEAQAESIRIKAEADAAAIKLVADAKAYEAKALSEVVGSKGVIALKGYESLGDIADGNATKIYMPADLTGSVAKAGLLGEAFKDGQTEPLKKVQPKQSSVDACATSNPAHKNDAAQVAGMMNRPKAHLVHDPVTGKVSKDY